MLLKPTLTYHICETRIKVVDESTRSLAKKAIVAINLKRYQRAIETLVNRSDFVVYNSKCKSFDSSANRIVKANASDKRHQSSDNEDAKISKFVKLRHK